MESELESLLRELIREEIIGTKGGVRLYQMGGSLPTSRYNLDDLGRPTRDPGVAGLRRRRRARRTPRRGS